jgi:diaminopropionate ammonia-lyase
VKAKYVPSYIRGAAVGCLTLKIAVWKGSWGRRTLQGAEAGGRQAFFGMHKKQGICPIPCAFSLLRSHGATVVVTDVNYDDTVRLSCRMAEENGWYVIQDTAWEGYTEIPLWIMQG